MINLLFHYIGNQLDSEAHLNWETNTMYILYHIREVAENHI